AELKGDTRRVKMLVEKYRNDVSEDSDMDLGHYHLHAAVCSIMEEDFNQAIQHAQAATRLIQRASASFQEHHCRMVQAYIYSETGQYDLAEEELAKSQSFFNAFSCHSGNVVILFVRSWIALNRGEHDRYIHYLKEALNLAYDRHIRSCFFWPHKIVRKLCATALDNNIHSDIVRTIIKIYQYTPDQEQAVSDHWPYRIKIYTLSRFGIVKDDVALRLSDKHQQFIKALIAFGGRDVHEETLSSALWPDADGDVAHQNFATTLHRVRKDIGNEVLLLRQNHLSLNPDFCWIDIWALKRSLSEIEKSLMNERPVLIELVNRAISLYQGPFLGADEHQFWILPAREQMRNKYLGILNKLGDRFCQINEYQLAMDCYQKGLEVDDLSESHYQGLLNCHVMQGNRAEGLSVYQRCYKRLAEGLGIAPSKKTEELRFRLENI
ncbi:MAG: bacterial transcriptional activator domain-containing protein, partial [Gammaproteobacteria bacterium]|nr:bacterial transcriptional activator domain-containing protein [Gammaproteobacteria bacterium]